MTGNKKSIDNTLFDFYARNLINQYIGLTSVLVNTVYPYPRARWWSFSTGYSWWFPTCFICFRVLITGPTTCLVSNYNPTRREWQRLGAFRFCHWKAATWTGTTLHKDIQSYKMLIISLVISSTAPTQLSATWNLSFFFPWIPSSYINVSTLYHSTNNMQSCQISKFITSAS